MQTAALKMFQFYLSSIKRAIKYVREIYNALFQFYLSSIKRLKDGTIVINRI